uniref:Uncharacterized protein n=1 Tax=Cacopsylla melanoneura TaxID=428564 RepID=A0A8D8PVF8_9HEMI
MGCYKKFKVSTFLFLTPSLGIRFFISKYIFPLCLSRDDRLSSLVVVVVHEFFQCILDARIFKISTDFKIFKVYAVCRWNVELNLLFADCFSSSSAVLPSFLVTQVLWYSDIVLQT